MEIIGEAVKKIPDEIRDGEPSIPWKQIAGMRDFLTHVYFSVNLERVWQAIDGSNLLDSKLAVTRIIAAIHFNRKKVYIRENEKTGQTQDPSVIRLSTMGDAMNNSGV